jgi:FkbM family methyltransferase
MNTNETLIEIVNHIINKHPELSSHIESLAALSLGKGFNSLDKSTEVNSLKKFLTNKPLLAIDIGGNVGDYSATLLSEFPSINIHTFEPSATNIEILHKRFLNNPKIKIIPKGISTKSGVTTLYSDHPGSGMASLTKRNLSHFKISFDCVESIETISFNEYWIHNIPNQIIDIVKIDIEGHELQALQSFGPSIAHTKVIQFEFGGTHIDSRNYFRDFWDFFEKNNFSLFRITPHGHIKINKYNERDECFISMNYIATNNNLINFNN